MPIRRRDSAVGALVLVMVIVLASTAGAQTSPAYPGPSPTPVLPSESSSPSPTSSPEAPALWDIPGRISYGISSWLGQLAGSALSSVFTLLGKTVFSTPKIQDQPRIAELWTVSAGIANAALILFVLVGSGLIMGGGGLATQLSAKELLPRVLVAAAAVNLSRIAVGLVIAISNGLAQALLGSAVDPAAVSAVFAKYLVSALTNPLMIVFALAVVVLAVLVLIAYVIRIAALVLLVSGAPLLLVTHSLPQTEGLARTWWRAMIALIAAPVAQSLLLSATVRVFLSSDGVLGLPGGGGLIDLLVVGCLLYMLFKIPFWAWNSAFSGAGSRAWSAAKQKTTLAAKAVVAA